MKKKFVAIVTLAAAFVPATPLRAQTAAAPSTASYDLTDPAPDDALRSLCTDRPTKSNLPCTVDAGHFQYEADIFNWSYSDAGGEKTDTYLFTNPTLKLGLTNTLDFELNMSPFELVTVKTKAGRGSFSGVGDLYLRLKANLAGADGGDFQAAVIPYVKAPTAEQGIGNGAVEGGAIAPVSFALPGNLTLLFDPEIDVLRNALDTGRHANFQFLGNLSRPFSDTVTGAVELWGETDDDPSGATREASLDFSVSWLAKPNLQFDVGLNAGLTPETPKVQPYIGISQRF